MPSIRLLRDSQNVWRSNLPVFEWSARGHFYIRSHENAASAFLEHPRADSVFRICFPIETGQVCCLSACRNRGRPRSNAAIGARRSCQPATSRWSIWSSLERSRHWSWTRWGSADSPGRWGVCWLSSDCGDRWASRKRPASISACSSSRTTSSTNLLK